MGQYYKPVSLDKKEYIYTHSYNSGLKLMEHSWLKNGVVNTVASLLKEGGRWFKTRIVWAGDYADDFLHLTPEQIAEYKEKEPQYNPTVYFYMGEFGLEIKPTEPKGIVGKYLVNHTKKEVVSLAGLPSDDGWVVHPLPLLTACGNNRGGGDFRGENDYVGTWAGDVISVQDTIKGTEAAKFTKIKPDFAE